MAHNENENKLSFTRLSFTSEDTRLDKKIRDEIPNEALITGFGD